MDQLMRPAWASMARRCVGWNDLGCLVSPVYVSRGRRVSLAVFFVGMAVCIRGRVGEFRLGFLLTNVLQHALSVLFFLASSAATAIYSLWLPEHNGTSVRATASAFTTSFGRLTRGVQRSARVGHHNSSHGRWVYRGVVRPAFIVVAVVPFAAETKGERLPRLTALGRSLPRRSARLLPHSSSREYLLLPALPVRHICLTRCNSCSCGATGLRRRVDTQTPNQQARYHRTPSRGYLAHSMGPTTGTPTLRAQFFFFFFFGCVNIARLPPTAVDESQARANLTCGNEPTNMSFAI